MSDQPTTAALPRIDPPQVVMSGTALRQLVNLAQAAITEHRYTEVKLTDTCVFEDCDSPGHPDCPQWGTEHDPTSCGACVPIRIARRALGDAL